MYTEIVDNTKFKSDPLVYTIEIGEPGDVFYKWYVGKSSNGHARPLKKYPKSVRNYETDRYRKTYKGGEVIGTRPAWRKHIHPQLSEAKQNGWSIKLTLDPAPIKDLDNLEQLKINEMVTKYGTDQALNIQLLKGGAISSVGSEHLVYTEGVGSSNLSLPTKIKIMNIALIAHDNKKADMVAFVSKRLPFFNREDVTIVTTGTTGKHVKHAGIKNVDVVLSGPLGGDAQIASMVCEGQIDLVIFLRDPLDKHPHDVDISMLMRLCDVHNVPLATNYKTASYLIKYFKSKL